MFYHYASINKYKRLLYIWYSSVAGGDTRGMDEIIIFCKEFTNLVDAKKPLPW